MSGEGNLYMYAKAADLEDEIRRIQAERDATSDPSSPIAVVIRKSEMADKEDELIDDLWWQGEVDRAILNEQLARIPPPVESTDDTNESDVPPKGPKD